MYMHPRQLIFSLEKVTALGVLLCLVVCLILLASFFLLSLKHVALLSCPVLYILLCYWYMVCPTVNAALTVALLFYSYQPMGTPDSPKKTN